MEAAMSLDFILIRETFTLKNVSSTQESIYNSWGLIIRGELIQMIAFKTDQMTKN